MTLRFTCIINDKELTVRYHLEWDFSFWDYLTDVISQQEKITQIEMMRKYLVLFQMFGLLDVNGMGRT